MLSSSRSLAALSLLFGIDSDRGAAAYVVVPPGGPLCGRLRRLRRRGMTTTTTTSAASTSSDYYPNSDADADADEWEHPPFADGAVGGGGVVDAGSDFYPDEDDIRPYIRIRKRGRHYDVQTAITTFRKCAELDGPVVTVDLHAQIHFGDASYYRYFDDDDAFGSRYDRVLYELIVEDRFLEPASSSSSSLRTASTAATTAGGASILRRLIPAPSRVGGGGGSVNPVAPTQADRDTALQYGLQCQVDGIRYCREGWVHADLTREEFLAWLESDGVDGGREPRRRPPPKQQGRRPLWALASASSASYPGSEFVSSLLRPLATTTAATSSPDGSAAMTRRLFTHLFLPGDALSGWIRAALWLGVPSPELSIMLVDWSSLSHVGRRSRSRRRRGGTGGTPDDDGDGGIAPISPIAAPVLLSLLAGNWGTARRLVFGQVLAAGQSNADSSRNGVLIGRRNDRAVDVLRQSLSSPPSSSSGRDGDRGDVDGVVDPAGGGARSIALLYGAGHCRDLHRRLVRTEGMTPARTEWRTAFRATVPRWGDLAGVDGWVRSRSRDVVSSLPMSMGMGGVVESMSVSTLESVAVGIVVLPLYMLVGGFDWVTTISDLESSFRGGAYLDGIAAVMLYLVRHVAMYVGIAKFVVDWGRTGDGIFDDDDSA